MSQWEPKERTPLQIHNAFEALEDNFFAGMGRKDPLGIVLPSSGRMDLDFSGKDDLLHLRLSLYKKYDGKIISGEIDSYIYARPTFGCEVLEKLPERQRRILIDTVLRRHSNNEDLFYIADRILNPRPEYFLPPEAPDQGPDEPRLKNISTIILQKAFALSDMHSEKALIQLSIELGQPSFFIRADAGDVGVDFSMNWDIYKPREKVFISGYGVAGCSWEEGYVFQNLINQLAQTDREHLAQIYTDAPLEFYRESYRADATMEEISKIKERLVHNVRTGALGTDWLFDG